MDTRGGTLLLCPLVLSAAGGIYGQWSYHLLQAFGIAACSEIGLLIATAWSYICWLRSHLSYSLLRSSIQAIRGSRSSQWSYQLSLILLPLSHTSKWMTSDLLYFTQTLISYFISSLFHPSVLSATLHYLLTLWLWFVLLCTHVFIWLLLFMETCYVKKIKKYVPV